MATGVLPKPGTKWGPCEDGCIHKDCTQTRAMAIAICGLCPEQIGYDTEFYDDREFGLVHAECLERHYER
jgi:hypothetical protein